MGLREFVWRSIGARVLLVVASTVALLATATGPALAAVPAHQPDLLLGTVTSCCSGNGVHESWPNEQQLDAPVAYLGHATYYVLIQNGGNAIDTFRIVGERTYSGVHVRYFAGSSGNHEITSKVVGKGYFLSHLAPGDNGSLRIRVSAPAAPVGFERSIRVIARSVAVHGAMDAVSFAVTVTK